MTKDERLEELAQRCEAATGPDRELDGAVRKAVHGDFGFCGDDEGAWWCCACTVPVTDLTQEPGCGAPLGMKDERTSYPSNWREDDRLPRYTASIDAALTLVPEGWNWLVQSERKKFGLKPSAQCWPDGQDNRTKVGEAATPALALTAAALRAQIQGTDDE